MNTKSLRTPLTTYDRGYIIRVPPDAEERAYFLKTQAQRRQRHLKGKKHNQMRGQDKVCMVMRGQDKVCMGTYYL